MNNNYLSNTDEREDVQKKTFTKWINSQLSKVGIQIKWLIFLK